MTEVVILGGGPAGLSAGLWLRNLGIPFVILERRDTVGGMPKLNFLGNESVLGFSGLTGVEIADRFLEHAKKQRFEISLNTSVEAISKAKDGTFRLWFHLPNLKLAEISCRAIILATGLRYRGLEIFDGVPGLHDCVAAHPDIFVLGPHAFSGIHANQRKHVVIVGGGDNAFENAILLVEHGARVTVVMRSQPRASSEMRAKVAAMSNICQIAGVKIAGLSANGSSVRVEMSNGKVVHADKIHVLAGYWPNSEVISCFKDGLSSQIGTDEAGYILADTDGTTGIPEVYAVGDVCNPRFQSIVGAMAQGARVAKLISSKI